MGESSVLDIDFRSAAFRADPYPFYRRLREESPCHRQLGSLGGTFIAVTRYRDVEAVLRDARSSVHRPFQPVPVGDGAAPSDSVHPLARALRAMSRAMLFRDPPDHTHLRGLVNKAFTPRTVERLRPRIEELAHELLAPQLGRGELDLMADFAEPFPLLVIAELLGVPTDRRHDLKRWSDDLAIMLDGSVAPQFLAKAVPAAIAFSEYLHGLLAERRDDPREDLVTQLLQISDADDRLSDDEIVGTLMLLLGAGHVTTTHLIGNAMLALLQHPAERERLAGDDSLLPTAIEEFLRFDPPVQATSRIPTEDMEVGGHKLPQGVEVALFLAAANRDPEVFADPDRLDVGRSENRHLSFGSGVHFCLGAGLARLEGQIAIRTLLASLPDPELATRELSRRPGFLFRALEHLPVRFEARARGA
ncbi:MAG: cytochrome P450 [Proteobacteria bacterium]|nr:cytochrome P450 [Pseudomonadota bacterium]